MESNKDEKARDINEYFCEINEIIEKNVRDDFQLMKDFLEYMNKITGNIKAESDVEALFTAILYFCDRINLKIRKIDMDDAKILVVGKAGLITFGGGSQGKKIKKNIELDRENKKVKKAEFHSESFVSEIDFNKGYVYIYKGRINPSLILPLRDVDEFNDLWKETVSYIDIKKEESE
jgi:hypothetical protein